MPSVPFTFADQDGEIPLEELDINFANVKAYANTAGTVLSSAQPSITSVGTLTSLSVAGNVNAGNVNIETSITGSELVISTISSVDNVVVIDSSLSIVGNISSETNMFMNTVFANSVVTNFISSDDSTAVQIQDNLEVYGSIITNGELITNVIRSDDSSSIQLQDNIEVYGQAQINGSLVTSVITSIDSSVVSIEDGLEVHGDLLVNGYYYGNGSQLVGIQATEVGNLESLSVIGNAVIDSNITAGGNITTAGGITAVGNITGNYFFGNGSQLSGVVTEGPISGNLGGNLVGNGYGAMAFSFLSTSGNVNSGNIINLGTITTNGNIVTGTGSGGSITNANVISANIISASGNVLSAGRIAVLSTNKRSLWVSNVAPTNADGANGDIWFQY